VDGAAAKTSLLPLLMFSEAQRKLLPVLALRQIVETAWVVQPGAVSAVIVSPC